MADSSNSNPSGGAVAVPQIDPKDLKATQRKFWDTINPGYVVAGVSTALLSVMSIKRNAHKVMRELELNKPVYDLARKVAQKHFKSSPDLEQLEKKWTEILEKDGLNGMMRAVDAEAAKNLNGHGIKDNIVALWQDVLKGHHKIDVVLKVATVTSFAMGAIYSFTRERHLAERLHRQIAQNSSQIAQTNSNLQFQLARDTGSLRQQIENERQQQDQGVSR